MAKPVDIEPMLIERDQMSLRQVVSNKLRDSILVGALAPGQKLVERDLSENLGVSRTLLREALQQLQAEGLITNVLHRGPSVAIISMQDARELYEVRELLERRAGEGFARSATDKQVEELSDAVEALRSRTNHGDENAVLAAKNRFYEVLLGGCGNSVIAQLLTQLNNRTTMLRHVSLSHPGRLQQSIGELEAIVSAARDRNPEEAGRLCAAHVARAAEIALDGYVEPVAN